MKTLVKGIWVICLMLALLLGGSEAQAGQLSDRLAKFPHWESQPPVTPAKGDLVYPDWMEGNWQVSSTLVDLVAPLAPEVVTPGFESNRRYLNQPVRFQVRFQPVNYQQANLKGRATFFNRPFVQLETTLPQPLGYQDAKLPILPVVADRAFNGLNIAKAYLGESAIQSVKVDPDSPNRQITVLRDGRQLVSIVTGRGTETPSPDQFIATEVSQQVFRGTPQLYFNVVETTTAYHQLSSATSRIEADQVTAVYLSPQDPNYFKALDRPVALYRYRLELLPIEHGE